MSCNLSKAYYSVSNTDNALIYLSRGRSQACVSENAFLKPINLEYVFRHEQMLNNNYRL